MPLIKHSPEFLAKQAKSREEKAQKEKERLRNAQIAQIEKYVDQVREFKSLNLTDPIDAARHDELLVTLVRQGVPVLEFLTLKECEFLREILRFAKLSGKFTSTIEDYRLMESIQKKNYKNIFHINALQEMGLAHYKHNTRSRQDRIR